MSNDRSHEEVAAAIEKRNTKELIGFVKDEINYVNGMFEAVCQEGDLRSKVNKKLGNAINLLNEIGKREASRG